MVETVETDNCCWFHSLSEIASTLLEGLNLQIDISKLSVFFVLQFDLLSPTMALEGTSDFDMSMDSIKSVMF